MMSFFEMIWRHLVILSGQWGFVAILFGITFLINRFKEMRRYTSGMVFPSLLLVTRKLSLFFPLPGTISSEDHVLFWSQKAYWYFFGLIILYVLIIFALKYREKVPWSDYGCLFFFIIPGLVVIGSVFLLPVGFWWNHIYLPVISLLGVAKIFLVSPFLVPITWATLFIQIVLVLFADGVSGREINKIALICVLVGGFVHFGLQGVTPRDPLIEGKKIERNRNFVDTWAAKLPEMSKFRINIVEIDLSCENGEEHALLLNRMKAPWNNHTSMNLCRGILVGLLALLLLFVFAERLRIGDEQDPYDLGADREKPG